MAQQRSSKRLGDSQLRRSTNVDDEPPSDGEGLEMRSHRNVHAPRPIYRGSADSEDTIRASATPPIDIPALPEDAILEEDDPDKSFMEHYMRNRQPSVSFNDQVKLDSGHKQSITEPLQKPTKAPPRGRSMLQALQDERNKTGRSHSETDREHFDPITGRHLPRYSTSPPREEVKIGEGRFPLLQTTLDLVTPRRATHTTR
jgi:hypothetical protein